HRIYHVHRNDGSFEFFLSWIRHYLDLCQGNLIYLHGQDETDSVLINGVGYFEGLFFQADKAEHDTVSFQNRHGKVTKTATGSTSAFFGHIDIYTRHGISTVGIQDNPGKLDDFFLFLILCKRTDGDEYNSQSQNQNERKKLSNFHEY